MATYATALQTKEDMWLRKNPMARCMSMDDNVYDPLMDEDEEEEF